MKNNKWRDIKNSLHLAVCLVLLFVGAYAVQDMVQNERQKQEYIQSHNDYIIYWSNNPVYFYRMQKSGTGLNFKFSVGYKVYGRGVTESFAKSEMLGPTRSFELDLSTVDTKAEKVFKGEPHAVELTREVCNEYGISFDKFYPEGDSFGYREVLIWDDVIFFTSNYYKSLIYRAYDKEKNDIANFFVKDAELHSDTDNIIDAEYYNAIHYYYDEQKKMMYVFYRDGHALLVKAMY